MPNSALFSFDYEAVDNANGGAVYGVEHATHRGLKTLALMFGNAGVEVTPSGVTTVYVPRPNGAVCEVGESANGRYYFVNPSTGDERDGLTFVEAFELVRQA